MAAKKDRESKVKAQSGTAVRATISFPPELYETLGDIAKQNKVSLAWVVREAAEQYVGEKWPLFKRQG
ncbi:MAG: CopG family transcriptional regulator [Terriglobia bacterium]